MREEILMPLAASGARSVTIAPETGTDDLRKRLNKPITNGAILEAAETAQRCGIESLKMYFIIGLPGESDEDLDGIGDLLREAQKIMVSFGRARGRVGTLHAGFNVLVPKPYTPYSREAMMTRAETRRRMKRIEQALSGVANLKIDWPSYREAQWQAYLSRGDSGAFEAIEMAASGAGLGAILAAHRQDIDSSTLQREVADPPTWRFITSAPSKS